MDNINEKVKDSLKKIYKKPDTFFKMYGGSFLITILTLLFFSMIFSYYYINVNLKPIKADWVNRRCDPRVMPFAGFINAPPGKSKFDFTASNFSGCTSSILKEILGDALKPIYYAGDVIMNTFKLLAKAVDAIRKVFNSVKNEFTKIVKVIMNRILNVVAPVLFLIVKIKNMFSQTIGVLVATLFTFLGIYDTLKSLIGVFLTALIAALVVLAALMIIMWIFPWTWPVAIIMTAIFLAVAVPTAIMAYWFGKIYDMTVGDVPKASCFDENTIIKTKEGDKHIKEINVGDILDDNSKVTATFKLSSAGEKIYRFHNTIVSGSHSILTNKGLVKICDHPKSVLIEEYKKPFLYCLSTTTKQIRINGVCFCDWDELDDNDWRVIKRKAFKYLPFSPQKSDIHQFLESGFVQETPIELEDGRVIAIKDICVNDRLRFGSTVLGIVEIENNSIIKKYKIHGYHICGTSNLQFIDNNLGNMTTLKKKGNKIYYTDKLYHLITDNKVVAIHGTKFYDYNGMMETLLEEYFLSSAYSGILMYE